MQNIELTQEEKIELLKNNLQEIVIQSELSISIIYPILNNYTREIEKLYETYQQQVLDGLNQKIEQNRLVQIHKNIEQELKNESPNFQVKEVKNNE